MTEKELLEFQTVFGKMPGFPIGKTGIRYPYLEVGVPTEIKYRPDPPASTILAESDTGQNKKLDSAIKYDNDKVDYSIMPLDSLEEIAKVFMFGAKKYDGWNFAKGNGMAWTRVWRSLMRHVFAWIRGEDKDPESGFSHLAHAGCNVFMLLHYTLNKEKYNQDDRYKY